VGQLRVRLRCGRALKKGGRCGRYVGTVHILDPHPHVGNLVYAENIYCQHCRAKGSYLVKIRDAKTVEDALRARMKTKRLLPAPRARA